MAVPACSSGAGRGGGRGRTHAEPIEPQGFLQFDQRIRALAADAGQGRQRGPHLRRLKRVELRGVLAEQQPRHDFVLRQSRGAAEVEPRRIRVAGDVQLRRRIAQDGFSGEVQGRIDLVLLQSGAVEAHAAGGEIQLASRDREAAALQVESRR